MSLFFLNFLKYSLNNGEVPHKNIDNANWHYLLDFAKRQSIVGVYWGGIKRLYEIEKFQANKPTDEDVM
ncbi:MAG: hypothetical protein IJV31_09635, partial [Clostridia bacterium]|nr:hypothetical protein [Clostridia bacterium]